MRVHELAKELGLKSHELLDRIQREGLDVKVSALASLDPAMVDRIRSLVNQPGAGREARGSAAAGRPLRRGPSPSGGLSAPVAGDGARRRRCAAAASRRGRRVPGPPRRPHRAGSAARAGTGPGPPRPASSPERHGRSVTHRPPGLGTGAGDPETAPSGARPAGPAARARLVPRRDVARRRRRRPARGPRPCPAHRVPGRRQSASRTARPGGGSPGRRAAPPADRRRRPALGAYAAWTSGGGARPGPAGSPPRRARARAEAGHNPAAGGGQGSSP